MKGFLGCLLILCGLAAGLYLGLWWAFIGGIVQIIEQVRAPELSAMAVAIGVAKIVCAGGIGSICAFFGIVPGIALLKS